LAKGPNIEPGLARLAYLAIEILLGRKGLVRPRFQVWVLVTFIVIRLDEDGLSGLHQPVPDLPLETDIRKLTQTVIGGARAVAVERVTVRVGIDNLEDNREINLIGQAHGSSPL
jgi:hypothetical protein